MRAGQIPLTLPTAEALGRADFFVSPANALALASVDDWRAWPQGKLLIVGPEGAGKTHLAQVWAAEAGARIIAARDLQGVDIAAFPGAARVVVEDADSAVPAADHALLHLHNHVLAGGGRLLLTARRGARHWPIGLRDLASRMQATTATILNAPDDALLSAVLVKLFTDRQITVSPLLIAYLVSRMERSLASARQLVAVLDERALARGGPISRALAAEVLDTLAAGLQ